MPWVYTIFILITWVGGERKEETDPSRNKTTQSEDKQNSIFCYFCRGWTINSSFVSRSSHGEQSISIMVNGNPLQYSCLENPMDGGAWWAAVHRVAKSRTRLSDFTFTFHFRALEKEMATHFSVLAWRIPGTGEPGGLPSMGLHRVGHDSSDLAAAAVINHLLLVNSSLCYIFLVSIT